MGLLVKGINVSLGFAVWVSLMMLLVHLLAFNFGWGTSSLTSVLILIWIGVKAWKNCETLLFLGWVVATLVGVIIPPSLWISRIYL